MKKKKEEPIYNDINSTMERVKEENKRYENATPEYKVLHDVLNNLSNAFYGIKYKEKSREDVLLELAEAKGKVIALVINELNKGKGEE